MLKQVFAELILSYNADALLSNKLWAEIEKQYGEKGRHYHTMSHLENIYAELLTVKALISDWDSILLALFYHDIIYKSTRKDNEQKSADLAAERLKEISYPDDRIQRVAAHIRATAKHEKSQDNDTNLFTDADLSILGKDWETYQSYFRGVRREYAIYPDFLYNPGRKKAMEHFLRMDKIFKTEHFSSVYESKARENIQRELAQA